jgi:hypothetical protein
MNKQSYERKVQEYPYRFRQNRIKTLFKLKEKEVTDSI